MNFIALKILTGDRAKYLGLIFAIAFCTFLLENQTSIFGSILNRTGSQILDVTDADDRCGRMGDGWEDRIFRTNQGAEGHRPDAGTGRERRRMGSETVQRLSRRPNPRRKVRFVHTLRPRRRDADWRSAEDVARLLGALT